MFWICTSVMANDIDHVFLCSLTIRVSSLEKYVSRSFAHFFHGFFFFFFLSLLLLNCKSEFFMYSSLDLFI